MFTETEIKELEPEPKLIVDLSIFIQAAKAEGYKIGVVAETVNKGFTRFKAGQFVLYKPYTANEAHGCMLWDEIKRHCQLCTTCMPYVRDGKVYTASCCVGVPLILISHEIKFD